MKHQHRIDNGVMQIMNCIKVLSCFSAYFHQQLIIYNSNNDT